MIRNIFSASGIRQSAGALVLGFFIAVPHAGVASISKSDQDFMMAAAQGGMTEVKLGQLAADNGTRQDVKDFGNRMVKDHSAINDSLKALASLKGVTLPDALDAKHQKMVDKLSSKTGSKFDDTYIAWMIKAHKMDAKAFRDEAAKTKDPDFKNFVNQSIPVIEDHLKMITAMKK